MNTSESEIFIFHLSYMYTNSEQMHVKHTPDVHDWQVATK